MNTQSIVVIIPAYEPDEKMLSLLEELTISISDVQIIVVNDGSSVDKTILFDKAKEYAKVINHDKNYGKGSAIRTGLAYIDEQFIEDAIIVVEIGRAHV